MGYQLGSMGFNEALWGSVKYTDCFSLTVSSKKSSTFKYSVDNWFVISLIFHSFG